MKAKGKRHFIRRKIEEKAEVWSKHSNFMGHIGLLLCIAAGFGYERTKARGCDHSMSASSAPESAQVVPK